MSLTREDLWSLEAYEELRPEFRARVLKHKKVRRVAIGAHATLLFESRLTVHYQVQEMLRTERIFRSEEIEEELDTYVPLIPEGRNLKATLLIEYPDADERRRELAKLVGVEHRVWAQVGDEPQVFAIADEDLERSTDDKTSAVHFLRFEFAEQMISAFKAGARVEMGIAHANLAERSGPIGAETCDSLRQDFA